MLSVVFCRLTMLNTLLLLLLLLLADRIRAVERATIYTF